MKINKLITIIQVLLLLNFFAWNCPNGSSMFKSILLLKVYLESFLLLGIGKIRAKIIRKINCVMMEKHKILLLYWKNKKQKKRIHLEKSWEFFYHSNIRFSYWVSISPTQTRFLQSHRKDSLEKKWKSYIIWMLLGKLLRKICKRNFLFALNHNKSIQLLSFLLNWRKIIF